MPSTQLRWTKTEANGKTSSGGPPKAKVPESKLAVLAITTRSPGGEVLLERPTSMEVQQHVRQLRCPVQTHGGPVTIKSSYQSTCQRITPSASWCR